MSKFSARIKGSATRELCLLLVALMSMSAGCGGEWAPQLTGTYRLVVEQRSFRGGRRLPSILLPESLTIKDEAVFLGSQFDHRIGLKFEDSATEAQLLERRDLLEGFSGADLAAVTGQFSLNLVNVVRPVAYETIYSSRGLSVTSRPIFEGGTSPGCGGYFRKELTLTVMPGIEPIENAYHSPDPSSGLTVYPREALSWPLDVNVARSWESQVVANGITITFTVNKRPYGVIETSGCEPGFSSPNDNNSPVLTAVYHMSPEVAETLPWLNPNREAFSSDVVDSAESEVGLENFFMSLVR